MATDIGIASSAMLLLRADPIGSFEEGSNEADICKQFYRNFVSDIMSRYPWSFCTKKRRLNLDSVTPVNEYAYSHIVPAECERVWAVYPTDSVGVLPITDWNILGSTGGRRIYSNNNELWAEYTYYLSEANWPGYFIQFAIHAFAALVALPVTDQADLAGTYQTLAYGTPSEGEKGGKFAVAVGIDSMQKPPLKFKSNPLVNARFS